MNVRRSAIRDISSHLRIHPESDPKIVVPDLVPTQAKLGSLAGYRDIFKGYIPDAEQFEKHYQEEPQGWLRIALASNKVPAYLDPTNEDHSLLYSQFRPSATVQVALFDVENVERSERSLSDVLTTYKETWGRLPNRPVLPGVSKRLERAIAFTGRVIGQRDMHVTGIHFPSTHEHGWVHTWRQPHR